MKISTPAWTLIYVALGIVCVALSGFIRDVSEKSTLLTTGTSLTAAAFVIFRHEDDRSRPA